MSDMVLCLYSGLWNPGSSVFAMFRIECGFSDSVTDLPMNILLFANSDWFLYNFELALASRLRSEGMNVILVSPAGPFAHRLEEQGFRWIEAPMGRYSWSPIGEARSILWLVRLLRRERVDIVHGFTIKCAVYGSIAARLARTRGRILALTGMGYVYTSQQLMARLLRPWLPSLLRLGLAGKAVYLVLLNRDDVAMATRLKLGDPDKIRLIPGSGVNCDKFAPGLRSTPAGPFKVLLPARLLWDKGVGEYVEAARILKAEGREIEFLLAGAPDKGNPTSVDQTTILQWQADGLVRWLDHVDAMPALFNSVDAVVLPSYREGLPNSLTEAAACGRCLITTDVPGCRDVVTHGQNGLIVPARNPVGLADAIRRVAADRKYCRTLGEAARETALQVFDEKIVLSQTLDIYRELGSR